VALIRGKEVQESPTQTPANPKLYNMITMQAGSRFSKNSPAKAHWIHAKYLQLGGTFVKSKKDVDPRMRDYAQEAQDKKEEEQKKRISKPVVGKPMVYVAKPGHV
jgi:hypothetical protein